MKSTQSTNIPEADLEAGERKSKDMKSVGPPWHTLFLWPILQTAGEWGDSICPLPHRPPGFSSVFWSFLFSRRTISIWSHSSFHRYFCRMNTKIVTPGKRKRVFLLYVAIHDIILYYFRKQIFKQDFIWFFVPRKQIVYI